MDKLKIKNAISEAIDIYSEILDYTNDNKYRASYADSEFIYDYYSADFLKRRVQGLVKDMDSLAEDLEELKKDKEALKELEDYATETFTEYIDDDDLEDGGDYVYIEDSIDLYCEIDGDYECQTILHLKEADAINDFVNAFLHPEEYF